MANTTAFTATLLPEALRMSFMNQTPKEGMNYYSPSAVLNQITPAICIFAVTGIYIVQIIYHIFFHPLRKVPGPFLSRFSEIWRNIRYFRGSWHDDIVQLHQKYGNVVRIAPNEVCFVDAPALKALYGLGKKVSKVCFI